MIKLLPDLPPNVVGIVASGHVSAEDYEAVLIPAVEAVLKTQEKVRLLYELGSDLERFAPGAAWDDMKLGLAHLRAWERIAVVTDIAWVAHATKMFGVLLPCPVKVFSLQDRAEAEAWIVA